jgi:hypothetical protein
MRLEKKYQKTYADMFEALIGLAAYQAEATTCAEMQSAFVQEIEDFVRNLIDRAVFPVIGHLEDGILKSAPQFTRVPSKYGEYSGDNDNNPTQRLIVAKNNEARRRIQKFRLSHEAPVFQPNKT